jgi:hypothetical protein
VTVVRFLHFIYLGECNLFANPMDPFPLIWPSSEASARELELDEETFLEYVSIDESNQSEANTKRTIKFETYKYIKRDPQTVVDAKARMYSFADKYGVQGLQTLALKSVFQSSGPNMSSVLTVIDRLREECPVTEDGRSGQTSHYVSVKWRAGLSSSRRTSVCGTGSVSEGLHREILANVFSSIS